MGSKIIEVLDITDQSFENEVLHSDIPVLVDYWAEWCGPCKMIGPILEEVAQEYKGQLKICKLNVDDNPETPKAAQVRGIPTLVMHMKGKDPVKKVGALSKAQLIEFLNNNLDIDMDGSTK